jgi:uncharacterized hydrophobic protein (TIGR00271 family)
MTLILFNNLTEKDKTKAVEHLIEASTPRQDFFFMIILSIITATFGLILNNVAVIIGSMLIAPMLYPFLSLSLGITISDGKLISRSFYTIVKAWAFGVGIATITSLLFSSYLDGLNDEILLRTKATLPHITVALAAGFAGSFALVKPKLNENLPGIAISVALIPPIAVTGIGVALLNPAIITGSVLLFLVNAIGIVLSGMVTLSLMNFYVKRAQAIKTVEKEDKKVELELKKAEAEKEKKKKT